MIVSPSWVKPLRRRRRALGCATAAAAVSAAVALLLPVAPSAGDTWDNSSGNAQWSDDTNWQDNTQPTSSDAAIFPPGFPKSSTTITLSSGEIAASLTLNDSYTLTGGNLALASGDVTVGSAALASVNSALIGTGGLTKLGAGTLTVGGTNTFTGGVSIDQGMLSISSDARLGNAANVVSLNGGTLATTASFSSSRTFTPTASSGSIAAAAGTTLTLGGALGANANAIAFNGSGTVALGAASTRTGTTSIQLGTVRLNNGSALGSGTINPIVGGVLEVNNVNVTAPLTLSLNGTLRGTGNATYAGTVTAGASSSPLHLTTSSTTTDKLTVATYAGGSGSTTFVAGSGTVVLPNANTYAGNWQIDSGTLDVQSASSLGSGTTAVLVNGGGTLRLSANQSRAVTLNGQSTLDSAGSIISFGSTTIGSGAGVTLSNTSGSLTLQQFTGGSGGSEMTVGPGTVVLQQNSTYSGDWHISGGATLSISADSQFGNAANAIFLGGTLRVDGSLTSNRTIQLLTSPTIALNQFTNATLTLSSPLVGGNGVLTVEPISGSAQSGGKLILQAASTRTGTTIIENCEVELQNATALGTGSNDISVFGTLRLTGVLLNKTVTLFNGATLTSTGMLPDPASLGRLRIEGTPVTVAQETPGGTLTLGDAANDITGSLGGATIQVLSPEFGGAVRLPFANDYPGAWIVENQTLWIQNNSSLGTGTSPIQVFFDGRLQLDNVTLNRPLVLNHLSELRGLGASSYPGAITVAPGATTELSCPTSIDTFTVGSAFPALTGGGSPSVIIVSGAGKVALGAASDVRGTWDIDGGTLQIASSEHLGNAANDVILEGGGTLRATTSFISAAGRDIAVNAGGGTFDSDGVGAIFATISGIGDFNKISAGNLTAIHVRVGALQVLGGKLTISPNGGAPGTSRVTTLLVSQAAGAQLDLKDNKLIITSSPLGSFNGSTYNGITGLIKSGRNGGAWNGTGIITSQSAATSGNFTTIGVATAAQAKGIAATATAFWSGQTVSGTDILVMYTYGGDANLDGKINVDDYGRIDFNVNLGTSGWFNGDFNYDGKINVDDYGIIDFNVGIQAAPFFTGSPTSMGLSSVPEPAVAGAPLVIGTMLLRRRRKSEPPSGVEPETAGLQNRCSAN